MSEISHLNKIKKQHAYLDKKSKEEFYPYKVKKKIKLAGNMLLDDYFFHVLTGQDPCKVIYTIIINKCDWENLKPKSKMKDIGYCDAREHELIAAKDLLVKIKDKENRFPEIGKLCNTKYREIIKACKKYYKMPIISKETREVMKKGTMYDDILSKLNLK